jgi:hypothetical protein
MFENNHRPTLDCDFWENKITRKIYRIKRKPKTQIMLLNDKIDTLLACISDPTTIISLKNLKDDVYE